MTQITNMDTKRVCVSVQDKLQIITQYFILYSFRKLRMLNYPLKEPLKNQEPKC